MIGGGSRIRTGDILLAKQTLYQLSYTPTEVFLVGVDGIEPSTSSLSGTRSNQLSYTPNCIYGRDREQKHLREVSSEVGRSLRSFRFRSLASRRLPFSP